MRLKYILDNTQAKLLNLKMFDDDIQHFVFDTRNLYFAHQTIFIALVGKSTDGHNYIADAYEKGVRHFLVSMDIIATEYPKANFLKVKSTIDTLQELARLHREKFSIPVIGVTGSTGKTSIKEWLYQLMTPQKKIVKNPRSYNSTLGVPLSLLGMRDWHEIAIFEAGPAAVGDMDPLVKMIQPNIGVFSNIGDAHSTNFISREAKIYEKLKLFSSVDTLIYCLDHNYIHDIVSRENIPAFTWSTNPNSNSNVYLLSKNQQHNGYLLTIGYRDKNFDVFLPYHSKAAVENLMHGITCLLYLDFSISGLQRDIPKLSQINMRMEMKQGLKNCTILDDSYSADLDSFNISMDFLERQSTKEKKTLIITDFVESENASGQLYNRIADYINGSSVSKVVCIGKAILDIKILLRKDIEFHYFKSTLELVDNLWKRIYFEDEVILVKGARRYNLDLLTNRLFERTHNTVLEVNMYGLAKNLKVYSELLKPKTKMMVMVKASAYGAGSVEVAKMLEYNHADYLAVAYADEGIYLRKHGIVLPIMVLNPEIPQFDHYIKYGLQPEIYSLKMMRQLADYLRLDNLSLEIHIKLESGMNRLGFIEDDIDELIDILYKNKQIIPVSIFSHLSSSGEEDKDEFTHIQIKRYLKSYNRISQALKISPLRHILNSAGIIRFPEYHFEMVRLGAGLYGIDSFLPFQDKISTVLSFKSRISQIKKIKKGDAVGYSRGFIAPNDMVIAVISAGYADGIPRSVSHGRYNLRIQGKDAPILGIVAMDMCMVDVTHIPTVREKDEVLIFGKNYPVEGLAKAANTISYEIFTSISERVKRVFYY